MIFANRREAGLLLCERLSPYRGQSDVVVLAIPRGGVVVGAAVARELGLLLDVIVTKKIGAPGNKELAIGAVAEGGEPVFEEALVSQLGVERRYLLREVAAVRKRIREYIKKFRGGRALDVSGKVVILTDDGVATGATMKAALTFLRTQHPKEIVLAVPTGAADSMKRLERLADQTICLDRPEWFSAVGQFYREFGQVEDEEVERILRAS